MKPNLDEHREDSGSRPSSSRLGVLFLGFEWGSSKGGLSTINRELAINVAKHPEVDVTFFVPRCDEKDKEVALGHNITLLEATEYIGMDELQWLCFPPPDLDIDVVFGHGVHLGPQANVISKCFKCKWVQVVHTIPEQLGMHKKYINPLLNAQEKHKTELKLCKEADFVVPIGPKLNEAFRSYLASCNKGEMFFSFTPGIFNEFTEVVHDLTRPTTIFRVLLLCRGDPEDFSVKGLDIAGKAVAALHDPSVSLVFVGAPKQKLEEVKNHFLQECGIQEKNLSVRGFIENREELKQLFSEMDLAIMPSRTEGFGLSGLEALSAGLPILVSGNSGFGEALRRVSFGSHFVVDSDNDQDWSIAIKKLRNEQKSGRLEESELLRSLYARTYSSEEQCKELIFKMTRVVQGERTQAPRGADLEPGVLQECGGNMQSQLREMRQSEENSQRELREAQQREDYLQRPFQQREENDQVQLEEVKKRKPSTSIQSRNFRDIKQRKDNSQGNLRENLPLDIPHPPKYSQRTSRKMQQPKENDQVQLEELIKKRKPSTSAQSRNFNDIQQRKDNSQGNLRENLFPDLPHPEKYLQRPSMKMQQPNKNDQFQLKEIKKGKPSSRSHLKDSKDKQQRKDNSQGNLRENLFPDLPHSEKFLQRPSMKMQQPNKNDQFQVEEIKRGKPSPSIQLRDFKDMKQLKGNSQGNLMENLLPEGNLQRQLIEIQQSEVHLQLREVTQHEENSQRELREMPQCHGNTQRQLRKVQQCDGNSRRQLRKVQQCDGNTQRQLRKVQQCDGNSRRQLREVQQRDENSQRERREVEQREDISQRQLREMQQREENLQRQLRGMQQREENSQRQLRELKELLDDLFQVQISTLERQLREKDREVTELVLTLSSAQHTASEQGRHETETSNWVISRDEIKMTDYCLGWGGWGSVYKGVYCGCPVAVKQIHDLILSPHNIRLFEREMNIASKCHHPYLLQFIGATMDEGTPLFVTELMEKSLRALLEQRKLSAIEIRVISLDVACALNYLHHKKPKPIIHRDVSSANVLLWRQDDQWRGKVSDYGTANVLQQTMTVAPGAILYSAPEALTSNQTVKVDVYSFGVLLCEMCIRQLPDPRRRAEQVVLVANGFFRGLVRRCLQRDPGARPTMQEIIDELKDANISS